MLKFRWPSAAALLVAGIAVPAWAQNLPVQHADAQAAQPGAMTSHAANGDLRKVDGQWKSSNLINANVYNDAGQSIGTIDDLLVGTRGNVDHVILSVGGFLGMDAKLVEVRFSDLRFEMSANDRANSGRDGRNSSAGAIRTGQAHATHGRSDYSILLPNSTKDSLKARPAFTYARE